MDVIHVPFDLPLPPVLSLRAGGIHCLYEEGNIRCIKTGNTEIAKMLYGAVRDSNWGTVPGHISDEKIVQKENSFLITYRAVYTSAAINYEARFRIEGRADNTICISMQGQALDNSTVNRIGLCVHLPSKECSSRKVDVLKDDGHLHSSVFPKTVSPYQLFTGIRKMSWEPEPGVEAEWYFEGDVFEMEDQRNWMDDSYKAYCRPLTLPFPFDVRQGDQIAQSITLKLTGTSQKQEQPAGIANRHLVKLSVPCIGYALRDAALPLLADELLLPQQVPFDHLLAELELDTGWQEQLKRLLEKAVQLRVRLSLVVFFSARHEMETDSFISALRSEAELVKSITLLRQGEKATPPELLAYVYPRIKNSFPWIALGYGTDAYFAELNRNRPDEQFFDFVSFSMNPQVHATDTRSVAGNINSIADIIATVRSFTGRPVHISPLTFKKRKNHDAAGKDDVSPADPFDERQYSWFAAGWFLLCLYHLSYAEQVSFFEITGKSSIAGNAAGEPTPLYKVLTALKSFEPALMWMETLEGNDLVFFQNNKEEKLAFRLGHQFIMLL